LAAAIARKSQLRVIGFDDDPQRVERTRRRLSEQGVYGTRVVVLLVPSLGELPQVSQFADLVVSQQRMLPSEGTTQKPVAADVPLPLVRPGGVAVLANPWNYIPNGATDRIPPEYSCKEVAGPNDQEWAVCVRQSPQGQGVWTHQYGTADNSAYGGESLAGASTSDELRVQWLGRPGPRAQADRSGRKPSPLSAGGRLYVQGLNRITALNAYNGTILWRLEIPDFSRFNIPRDSANWCADENYLYAVVRDRCWKINGSSGVVEAFRKVQPGARSDWQYDWGYVACADGVLLGSSVKQDTRHVDYWGGFGWYDDRQGVATFPVCSDKLFGLNASDGEPRWTYGQGLILNSTITASDGKVYFVESRNPKLREIDSHRVGVPEVWLDQFMVALDLQTGKTVWEVPLDTAKGLIMFHLAASGNRLVLLASDHRYNVYAFDATNGKQLWSQHFDWHSDNHGGHMSRPAIVGNKVFVRPRTLDLTTGELFKETMPGGGCGSYAATDNSLVFRAGNVTMWDMDDNSFSSWHRLRPDCWISTIPAGGMLLSPEGGGGCSCGSWLETSVGFIPEAFPPPKIVASAVKFVDRATVELISRGQAGGVVHYTLDGTDPDENSSIYEQPIELAANTAIKARTYWSAGKQGRPTASPIAIQQLTRVYPPPVALPKSIPFVDELTVNLARQGELGTIHFTLDGSEPTVDSPTLAEPLKLSSTVTLKAAIAYDDGTLGAVLTEKYSKIDTPWGEPVAVDQPQPGLICDCYEGNWKLLPDFAKETIKKTTVVPRITLEPRTINDAFGLRFRGFIKVPADGVYMFFTRSDDGSKLWIGDQPIVNNDGIHGPEEKHGWIALKAGLHPIQIDYWDALWGESLEVSYEGPGIARQRLPENVLFHEK
jgi:outer membrane protein assembly factor BamB